MSGPELVYEKLQSASHDVRDAAGRLRTEREAVSAAFAKVVGGDWTGTAADSFRVCFADWNVGLTDVEEGLAAMGELIDATKQDFASTDDGVSSSMDTIAARIVDRLG